VDEAQVAASYTRPGPYKLDYFQGAAVSADGTLFLMDIYPQLNVVCFPQLAAPRKAQLGTVSTLLSHAAGNTDHRQTEPLKGVQARVQFDLDVPPLTAQLYWFGSAKRVTCNGQPLSVQPLPSTGWQQAAVPLTALRTGANDFVFADGGQLLIDPNVSGHSSRSHDDGKTWSTQLGTTGTLTGEYLVRLRLTHTGTLPTPPPTPTLPLLAGPVRILERPLPPERSPVPFVYQAPAPRLTELRQRYRLDDVIRPGKTELEQVQLLRYWVRNQWHTGWDGGAHPWMPPWDALQILAVKDQPTCLTMCTHYAAVFTQCAQALGWNARHCILDHHCVSEIYLNSVDQWVMMDAGNSKQRPDLGLHFERKGVPLSARQLHLAYHQGATADLRAVFTPAQLAQAIAPLCRPAPHARPDRPESVSLAELTKLPVCQLNNYRRYAFPGRNTFLTTLLPGEPHQGWSEYFYDGYWWVGGSARSPEYSHHLSAERVADADWKLNQTWATLTATAQPNAVRVELATNTPNHQHYERLRNGQWTKCPPNFEWTLDAGTTTLQVRSVNAWERAGPTATVRCQVEAK
jgi:hypothetical protein